MPPSSSSGLPRETLEPILRAIYDEVAEIRQTFSSLEIRMVGASLLVIYEADWTRAEQSLTSFSEEEDEKDEDDDIDDNDHDHDDDDDDDDEINSNRPGPPFVVKLIDFAHTRLAPGEGPDQSVLIGLDTILKLLDARLEEIGASWKPEQPHSSSSSSSSRDDDDDGWADKTFYDGVTTCNTLLPFFLPTRHL